VVFIGYLVGRFGAAREDLRVAKADAFESIHLLWKARAIAYDANADESRYLLDRRASPTLAQVDENAFFNKVKLLTTQPDLRSRVAGELFKHRTGGIDGLFADELRNVTFPGEWPSAMEMIQAYAAYYAIDAQIRKLETSGQHDKAVDLCIGSGADQSNAAFAKFDQALDKTIQINRSYFDSSLAAADGGLRRAELFDPAFAVAIALLAYFGLRPRIREYAG
jgi:hypothetical protein